MVAAKTDYGGELFESPSPELPGDEPGRSCAQQTDSPFYGIAPAVEKLFLAPLALLGFAARAQVTFEIMAVPANPKLRCDGF